MKQKILGATGISVSEYALGAMMFGAMGNPDHADAARIINRAIDAGITIIDTADVYSLGESEQIVGQALTGRRDEVILATKFGLPMGGDDANRRGGSRRWIMRAVEDSLRRLNTDYIDLYQMHRADYATPVDETLAALSDLVRSGKVRAIGSSTFSGDLIVEGQWTAERRQRERFVCEQPPYSILARGIETEVLPTCQRYGMGTIVWSPLNGGWLTGRYRRDAPLPEGGRASRMPARYDPSRPQVKAKLEAIEALVPVAEDADVPLSHLALAFTLAHPAVTAAIIGPRTMEQMVDALGAVDVALSDATLDRIDAVVAPGTTIDPEDGGWKPPALADAWRRRRPPATRSSGD